MSMMISTSTPAPTPQLPGAVAQPRLALPGADAATAFADFLELGVAEVAAEPGSGTDVQAPAAEDAPAMPELVAAELLQQEQQQPLASMQAMVLPMPAAGAIPAPALVEGGDAAEPPADTEAPAAMANAASSALAAPKMQTATAAAPLAAAVAVVPAAQPQQASSVAPAAAQPAFAAALGQAAAASAAQAAVAADAPPPADAPAAPASAAGATTTAAAPVAAATSELKLASATPAAWQQPLREALGDRLQLQLSRNIDQAVIRLDPPNLGRIEIAIRHMAGNLEVNISATHSEVVRQLNTISDTMRTDLAQRQFTEVAVNVTSAARGAGAAQQAFDQQGRQRQHEGAADEAEPGRALAEAGNPNSTFSLNARESYV